MNFRLGITNSYEYYGSEKNNVFISKVCTQSKKCKDSVLNENIGFIKEEAINRKWLLGHLQDKFNQRQSLFIHRSIHSSFS